MSPQNDDDGTVIRPAARALAASAAIEPPVPSSEAGSADSDDDGISLRIGARVSEFEITQRIGEGGFSIVYLAKDHSLERTVALKEYMPSSLAIRVGATQVQPRSQRHRDTFEAGLKSFVNEAKLLAHFDHPSLVKVYRFWEANGTAYMVMPYYQGVTVKDTVRAMPQPPDEAWLMTLLEPLTEALTVIHAEHCYHRDVAPDNVILQASNGRPLLLDFGAARRVIGDMTQGLTVILKAGYAPVEQYAEIPGLKQGPWTDVYALAAVVYWIITGSTPPASVARMMNDSFVPLAQCAAGRYSMEFLQAIDRALAVQPQQRTQSIELLRQELGLTGEGDASPSPSVQWGDSDATVIRPAGHKPGPATVATRRVPRSTTGPVTPERTAHTAPPSTRQGAAAVAAGDGATKARPLKTAIALSALGVVVIAVAIWWAMRTPSAQVSPPKLEGTNTTAVDPQPAQGGTTLPTGSPASDAPTSSSTTDTAVKPPSTIAVDDSKPASAAASTPAEVAPETPATRPPITSMPPDKAPKPVKEAQRPATRPEGAKAERAQTDPASKAECARILQRISLGESSSDLMARFKALNCR